MAFEALDDRRRPSYPEFPTIYDGSESAEVKYGDGCDGEIAEAVTSPPLDEGAIVVGANDPSWTSIEVEKGEKSWFCGEE
jgi:hypothetical protein